MIDVAALGAAAPGGRRHPVVAGQAALKLRGEDMKTVEVRYGDAAETIEADAFHVDGEGRLWLHRGGDAIAGFVVWDSFVIAEEPRIGSD